MALIRIAQFNILQRNAGVPAVTNDQLPRPEANIKIWIGLGNLLFHSLLQPQRH